MLKTLGKWVHNKTMCMSMCIFCHGKMQIGSSAWIYENVKFIKKINKSMCHFFLIISEWEKKWENQ